MEDKHKQTEQHRIKRTIEQTNKHARNKMVGVFAQFDMKARGAFRG